MSQLSAVSEVTESANSTRRSDTDESHSRTDSGDEPCSSCRLSMSEESGARDFLASLELDCPRPYPAPKHSRRSQPPVISDRGRLRGQHHWAPGARPTEQKWREPGAGSAGPEEHGVGTGLSEPKQKKHGRNPGALRREDKKPIAASSQADCGLPQHTQLSHIASRQRQHAKHANPKHAQRMAAAHPHGQSPQPPHTNTQLCVSQHHRHTGRHTAEAFVSWPDRRHAHESAHERRPAHWSDRQHAHHHAHNHGQLSKSSMAQQHDRGRPAARAEHSASHKKLTHSRPTSAAGHANDSHSCEIDSRGELERRSHAAQQQQDYQDLPPLAVSQQQPAAHQSGCTEHMQASAQKDSLMQHEQAVVRQEAGLKRVVPVSDSHSVTAVGNSQAAAGLSRAGLHGTAHDDVMQQAALHGNGLQADMQVLGAGLCGSTPVTGLIATAAEAGLHGEASLTGRQAALPGPMEALMKALEHMTSLSQQKLAGLSQIDHKLPATQDAGTPTPGLCHFTTCFAQ